MGKKIPRALAVEVKARAVRRCEYCHVPEAFTGQPFHFDHIIPKCEGGKTSLANLCLACPRCNLVKGDKITAIDPHTKRRVRLFNPRTEVWEEHFPWNNRFSKLIGLTPKGRATIIALDMNHESMEQARRFWPASGLFP